MTDLGPSWLRSLPDAQPVTRRDVSVWRVAALFDGYFSAQLQGSRRRRYFDLALVAEVLSLGAEERRLGRFGEELDLRPVWSQHPPETVAARRRSHNLIAGLPQIYIGR